MRIILIAGKARSGKSSCASLLKTLCTEKNYKVAITEYSKYIKLFAKEFIGWDGVSSPKPRKFLQDFGSYVRHSSNDPYYFIRRMKEDIAIYEHFVDILIISDVRFPSEITELEYLHPLTIKVENNLEVSDLSLQEQAHETEHALDNFTKFDYSIKDKSLNEMREILKKIVEEEL